MDNYTPNPFKTQPIYDPTRPFATPKCGYAIVMSSAIHVPCRILARGYIYRAKVILPCRNCLGRLLLFSYKNSKSNKELSVSDLVLGALLEQIIPSRKLQNYKLH